MNRALRDFRRKTYPNRLHSAISDQSLGKSTVRTGVSVVPVVRTSARTCGGASSPLSHRIAIEPNPGSGEAIGVPGTHITMGRIQKFW